MAFHQPTRQLPQRISTRAESEDGESAILAPQAHSELHESQTWVLFTPGTDAGTATSYMSSVQDDQLTPGRSRISDLGSLGTAARSDFNSQPDNSAVHSDVIDEGAAEDDTELDSLDSHLPEFRTVPNQCRQQEVAHAATVLPGHDGLGSFKLDAHTIDTKAQDRLYAFERFNPNRIKRRRESFDLARLELENEEAQEAQELKRNQRIEAWRLEQSQLLLEDIQKETRRRRQSEVSLHDKSVPARDSVDRFVPRTAVDETLGDSQLAGTDWHDQDGPQPRVASDGLWSLITRKVICDLMGIDGKLLAVLFGKLFQMIQVFFYA